MGSQRNFLVEVLDDGEAWDLFIQKAGECDKNSQETAREIVRECDGLPIAIVTVASALKGKPAGVWDDSLRKLQRSNLLGISGMDKVYSRMQLSYDLLNDREARSCFLLCCLFPEDYDVRVENLVFYGWGLELFEGMYSLKEARDRVDSIIDKLKKSFLLLDGNRDGYVKLHDLLRDFAISVSSKEEYPYLVRCEKEMKWPETCQLEKCRAISFVCENIKDDHLVDLRCPNLKILQLHFEDESCELPIGFLKGMEELKVVDMLVPPPSPALIMQKKLRTLLINTETVYSETIFMEPVNYFREMLVGMKNLEIFALSAARFSDFPVEIGQLCNLRCLRFHSVNFEYLPPGVLSKLVKLEELELPLNFDKWGLQEEGGVRVNASLNEIESLPLTRLFIRLPKDSVLAEKLVESITRFRISIGSYPGNYGLVFDENVLEVDGVDACYVTANWMGSLVRKCDKLILRRVRELKYIMFQQLRGNNVSGLPCTYFSRLKTLEIMNMDSLREIWDGPYLLNIQPHCFPNLTDIEIYTCPKLKRVFPLSVAVELTQLQQMQIRSCEEMEEIFFKDQADDGNQVSTTTESTSTHEIQLIIPRSIASNQVKEESREKVDRAIAFPRLKRMLLDQMPKLRILCSGNHAIECPSLEELKIMTCNSMEGLSYGSFNAPISKDILLGGVRHVKNIIKWLHWEQDNGIPKLTIRECHEMKYLVDAITDPLLLKAFFTPLEELTLERMDSLEEMWHGPSFPNIQPPCFPNLTKIFIFGCRKPRHVFPLSVATQLGQLQHINVWSCEEMEEIFYNDQITEEINDKVAEREADHVIALPRLKILHLSRMPKLRVLYNGNHAMECPSLEEVAIEECNNMEALSYKSFNAPTTKQLTFEKARYLKDIIECLHFEQQNGIPHITELTVRNIREVKYLIDAVADPIQLKTFFSGLENLTVREMYSLEEIWHGPCFSNLTQIEIEHCPKLKHVFPLSVATQLRQLQHIYIHSCQEMEKIFYTNQLMEESAAKVDEKEDDGAAIIFPRLRTLTLFQLSELRILYDGNRAMELPSLEELEINACDKVEAICKGSFKAPKLKLLQINWKTYSSGEVFNEIPTKTDDDEDNMEEGSYHFADYSDS